MERKMSLRDFLMYQLNVELTQSIRGVEKLRSYIEETEAFKEILGGRNSEDLFGLLKGGSQGYFFIKLFLLPCDSRGECGSSSADSSKSTK